MILLFQSLPTWFFLLMLILVSACIGSFLNVVIHRLPLMLHDESMSLSTPHSHCPHCRHAIHWQDNIPLVSYFLLYGKCRHCRTKITWRYPLIEASTIVFSLLMFTLFGRSDLLLAALLFTWWLIPMTVIDLDHFLLPDQLTLGLLWFGLLINLQGFFVPLPQAVLGAVVGYGVLWLVSDLYRVVRKKEGLGQGDWKLLAAFGAWFGWMAVFYILAIAAALGALIGIGAILLKRAKLETALPFGPFLCVAALVWFIKNTF